MAAPAGRPVDRRTVLRAALGVAGTVALGSCSWRSGHARFVDPSGAEVVAAERRRKPGKARDFNLVASAAEIDLGGLVVSTWSYGGRLPGDPIRVTAGEQVRATLTNRLSVDTSIHWHGLSLRNDADGAPGVTQPPVWPGTEFVYQFTAAQPGTFWFHPHVGTQLDRGLYAPLIVEDPHEPLGYDAEWLVVLDDWLDGVGGTPDDAFAELTNAGGMRHGMSHGVAGAWSNLLGGDAGDIAYPHYLLNGRLPSAPDTFSARPGSKVRMRLINAAADTAFRVALDQHRMTVTHTDGFVVEPVEADALLIGMGERYDVLVTLEAGIFPLVAVAEGKNGRAQGLVRTSRTGTRPQVGARPAELTQSVLRYAQVRPADETRLPPRVPDRTIRLELTGGMMSYDWFINGKAYNPGTVYPLRSGERVRLSLVNRTMMWHPMHLHGHTFALAVGGARKDTVNVLPRQQLDVDFDADNPGVWMVHCHNVYHAEAGMMTLLGYES